MGHKVLVIGANYDIAGGNALIDGTAYCISNGRTLVDGTGYDISFDNSIPASDLSEGSIVYLTENGKSVAFYVAKHNYESGLNGSGRTLLIRKECYADRIWNEDSDDVDNEYASSAINTWLNNTYKALFDTAVQTAMGSTTFYYTKDAKNTATVTTMAASIFLPSLKEFGRTHSSANAEGSALSIASTIITPTHNSSSTSQYQWTRTPMKGTDNYFRAFVVRKNTASYSGVSAEHCIRPMFTLPSTAKFDPETMLFTGAV